MPLTRDDAASGMLYFLQTHADAAAVRALVYGGVTNILESGDITAQTIRENNKARRDAGTVTNVLAITVWDGGEVAGLPDEWRQQVVIRVFDLGNGYRQIRAVRNLLRYLFDDRWLALSDLDGRKQGAVTLRYRGRTGFRQSRDFGVEFENLTFEAYINQEEE